MTAWLDVIGIGEDGIEGLPASARAVLEAAEVVVAPKRVLAGIQGLTAETHAWSSPLSGMVERILGWRWRRVVVLATGDPMHFGIGATLTKHVGVGEMRVIPSPSAFSLAAARLGWPLQDVERVSLHGRPVSLVAPLIQPGARILALTGGAQDVRDVASLLIARGYSRSRLTVLEHMGGVHERVVEAGPSECAERDFAAFHTLAVDCVADLDAPLLPRVPGLPDEAFRHDGQMTKREVRAVTLAALGPTPGALLWDVGAGCGSVAIEWMRAARGAQAIAFERNPQRLSMIAENAAALGTPDLEVVAGEAPASLDGQRGPGAVFLGGAVSDPEIFSACWRGLPVGGRLVANSVTLEGEAAVIERHKRWGGDLVRMDVSRVTEVGRLRGLRPSMSVLQWRVTKGEES